METKNKLKLPKGAVALKHARVYKNLIENVGKSGKKGTMREAMIDAGYTESYAEKGEITKTKTWEELMEEFLPDTLLASKHRALLEKTDDNGDIDTQAARSGLEMAYKMKGKYEKDNQQKANVTTINIGREAEIKNAIDVL